MRSIVVGVLVGGVVCLTSMVLLGAVHRYVYGPALAQFGEPRFFTDMTSGGIFWLVVMRVFSAWLGSSVAVRLSDEPHATWIGPAMVAICALTTVTIMGMPQPIWSLVLSLLATVAVGYVVGRAHVGAALIPGMDEFRARMGGED